jgi:archaemetzincin
MGEPQPGEWLYRFPEEHQSFDDYVGSTRNVKDETRRIVYLQPMGDSRKLWPETLEQVREYASIFFNSEVRILEPIPMFDAALAPDRGQYDSDILIRYLVRRLPEDALIYLGVADADLYAHGLNFVFGSASLVNRCGVYSLVRLKSEDPALFLRRTIGLICHEAGHIVGITHCVRFKCLMNGSNSLAESDRQPIFLCPEDLRKVQWNVKFEPAARYRKMLEFLKRHRLDADARWLEKHLRLWPS